MSHCLVSHYLVSDYLVSHYLVSDYLVKGRRINYLHINHYRDWADDEGMVVINEKDKKGSSTAAPADEDIAAIASTPTKSKLFR